ncbi:MAG: hypothetical protein IJ880_13915 [Bacilli bacterium]|nr:hypothetical protein [Bacilli bacterium]
MIIITYWHDDDDETITSVTCKTDKECKDICEVLTKYKMNIISIDTVPNPTTAAELEQVFEYAYSD